MGRAFVRYCSLLYCSAQRGTRRQSKRVLMHQDAGKGAFSCTGAAGFSPLARRPPPSTPKQPGPSPSQGTVPGRPPRIPRHQPQRQGLQARSTLADFLLCLKRHMVDRIYCRLKKDGAPTPHGVDLRQGGHLGSAQPSDGT
jgi:hypothetical protein